jgi:Winged helix DNA-binding domain
MRSSGADRVRTLTLRELNRATLARQLLLERGRIPFHRAIERLAGLQGQWPPSPYVGLWSRVEGFRRDQLERALHRGSVVKASLMRVTLHLVTARDYPMFIAALYDSVWRVRPDALELGERVAEEVRAMFADGPRSRTEVMEAVTRAHGPGEREMSEWMRWFAIKARAHLVHAPSTAMWRGKPAGSYVALNDVSLPDPRVARAALIRRYLGAFGPATRADVAEWSGLRVREIDGALPALEPLKRFRDEHGRELLDLPRAPLPPADAPAPVRFLPRWDNHLLGHADRRRVISDEHRRVMIKLNGDISPSVLVDGVVAGTWKVAGDRVEVTPFAPIPRRFRRDLEEERRLLEAFVR